MKNMKLISGKTLLIVFLILFALTGTAAAKEWTVGASGSDFPTIQAAVTAAADNDVIYIRSGTYSFSANLSVSKSISLIGDDKESVILDLGGFSIIPRKENFVLQSVTLKNGTNGINLQAGGVNALIENCIFDGMTHTDGIKLSQNGAVFKDNIVKNMSGFTNAVYITANDVKFIGNTLSGLSGSGSAARIVCLENAGNVLIQGNTITNNAGEAIRLWKAETSNAVITENTIAGNTLKGIYLYTAGENNAIFLNNIFDNAGGNVASNGTLPSTVLFNSPASVTLSYNSVSWTGNPGNYWGNDYSGADINGNGIGSTPKTILTVYADNAPLLNAFALYTAGGVCPEDPEQPEQPDPEDPELPEQPDPEDPEDPEQPEQPDPEDPEQPEQPDPEDPEQPEQPDPEDPELPEQPDPEDPEQPEQPDPEDPEDPEQPVKNQGGSVLMTANILPSLSVSFSVDSLDFGDLVAGQTSEPKSMEITNSGSCDIIVTAEVTDSSDDLYKEGLWMDDTFWPDYEKMVQKGQTVSSELVLKVPLDYRNTGNIDGTLILWVEAV